MDSKQRLHSKFWRHYNAIKMPMTSQFTTPLLKVLNSKLSDIILLHIVQIKVYDTFLTSFYPKLGFFLGLMVVEPRLFCCQASYRSWIEGSSPMVFYIHKLVLDTENLWLEVFELFDISHNMKKLNLCELNQMLCFRIQVLNY